MGSKVLEKKLRNGDNRDTDFIDIAKKMFRATGRPRAFARPSDLETAVIEYIETCTKRKAPLTLSGLANSCGVDRDTILRYSKDDAYYGTVKKLKSMIEQQLEEGLLTSSRTIGHIFALKNNHAWVDKREYEHSGQVAIHNIMDGYQQSAISAGKKVDTEYIDGELSA